MEHLTKTQMMYLMDVGILDVIEKTIYIMQYLLLGLGMLLLVIVNYQPPSTVSQTENRIVGELPAYIRNHFYMRIRNILI